MQVYYYTYVDISMQEYFDREERQNLQLYCLILLQAVLEI